MLNLTIENQSHKRLTSQDFDFGNELSKLIAITAPYYALNNVNINDHGALTADFPIELVNHNETRGISLSEAGRHMTILGSLALAYRNTSKEKHYYQATDAVFERLHDQPINADFCQGIVTVEKMKKKEGVVYGRLICADIVLYEMEIRYTILHEKIFKRLFSANSEDFSTPMLGNPFAFQTRFFTELISRKSCMASIGMVRREDCMGHFDGYPALPVARIGGAMVDMSGFHYNAIRNTNFDFCIRSAELHAENFIFAGDSVSIETKVGKNKNENEICSVAHSNSNQNAVKMNCRFF